ncbi:MAG: hypothetical protein PHF17_06635 [Arcobacteraceae bacterium]|nr:hypothetical protein [Arcobacteraceae bacterium]
MIKTLFAFITIIGIVFALINDSIGVYQNFIKEKRAEDSLEYLNTGLSIHFIKSIFGVPMVEKQYKNLNLFEYIYSFQKFYLQLVYDQNNTVKFYAITSKTEDFNPKIPFIKDFKDFMAGEHLVTQNFNKKIKPFTEIRLGKVTFFNLSNSANILYSNLSSKNYEYAESIYLANSGNYRNLYLAYVPAGYEFCNQCYSKGDFFSSDNESKSELLELRKKCKPNTFGIGDVSDSEFEQIFRSMEITIGIDYSIARDIPSLNY